MKYKSKIGLSLIVPIFLLLGAALVLMIIKNIWPGIAIILFVIAFVIHLFATTDYTIVNDKLLVRSGFLYKQTIHINTIVKIKPTRNPLSSPALSLDRLQITFRPANTVMVSPKERDNFIQQLRAVNPAIIIL